jgi:hypothetical protein
MASPHFQPAFYPPPFMPPNGPFDHPGDVQRAGSAGAENERTRLLEKVSNVLPDLNRLLHYYEESQGLLSEKDNLVKLAENQHLEETARLKVELSACKEEYEKIIGQQASENMRLKGEIEEQAEKIAVLESPLHTAGDADGEVARLRLKCDSATEEFEVFRSANEQLTKDKNLLEDEVQALKNQLHEAKVQHDRERTEWLKAHKSEMLARDEEYARLHHEHKVGVNKIQLDLAGMITSHAHLKKDLDSARLTISEYERALTSKTEELEHTVRSHAAELSDIRNLGQEEGIRHKEEVATLSNKISQNVAKHEEAQKKAERQLSELTRESEQREAKQLANIERLQVELNEARSKLEEEHATQDNLKRDLAVARQAHETLTIGQEQTAKHHDELAQIALTLRNKQAELQRESEKMDFVLRSLSKLSPGQGKSDETL